MSYLTLPWFVLITTYSATRMRFVFAAELLPVAVLGIPSSAVIERLGVRRTVVLGDAAQAILIGLVPALSLLKVLSFWAILVIVAGVGTVSAPYFAAQRLLLPEALGMTKSPAAAESTPGGHRRQHRYPGRGAHSMIPSWRG
jgi:MFS family permease